MPTVLSLLRAGVLDAELAALLWLLIEAGVPVHVAAPDDAEARRVAEALRSLAARPEGVSWGPGDRLEAVLRQPVPLRPASGAVLVLTGPRVVAAHLQRPPLRDAGGHVRPQAPAVLATWEPALPGWEHFAWGITPDVAQQTGRRPGDVEIELGRRREYLDALAGSSLADDEASVRAAIAGYEGDGAPQ